MTSPVGDPRAVTEYLIPARSLEAGDLVDTSAGEEQDWQQVLSVHTAEDPGTDADGAALISEIGDRYVLVRLTDVAPVDSPVYFSDGRAMLYGTEDSSDLAVTETLARPNTTRNFLYTRFELVKVRQEGSAAGLGLLRGR